MPDSATDLESHQIVHAHASHPLPPDRRRRGRPAGTKRCQRPAGPCDATSPEETVLTSSAPSADEAASPTTCQFEKPACLHTLRARPAPSRQWATCTVQYLRAHRRCPGQQFRCRGRRQPEADWLLQKGLSRNRGGRGGGYGSASGAGSSGQTRLVLGHLLRAMKHRPDPLVVRRRVTAPAHEVARTARGSCLGSVFCVDHN